MPHCPHCGAEHAAEARYCPRCGGTLPAAPAEAREAPSPSYAGFWRRVAASLVDALVLLVPIAILEAALGGSGIQTHDTVDPATGAATGTETTVDWAHFAIYQVASLLIWWFYFAVQESSARQATIGKRVLSIAVTDVHGNRLTFGRATGRLFAKMLSGLSLGIGYLMAAFTARKQALHDKVAHTLVVVRPRA